MTPPPKSKFLSVSVELSPPPGGSLPASPLNVGIWLAVLLVFAKAALLCTREEPATIWSAPMASYRDVIFALSFGLVGELVLRASRPRPALSRVLRGLLLTFALLCACYGMIAAGVYQYFARPLTYEMLRLVGDLGALRSSLAERITVPVALALISAAVISIVCAIWLPRRPRRIKAALVVAGIWIVAGWCQDALRPAAIRPRPIAVNPHLQLLRSTFAALTQRHRATLLKDFPPEDALDFQTYSQRALAETPGYQPPAGVSRPRNVIVIVLESVGTKYLSLYGSGYDTSPVLTAESAHALVFENFYVHAPYTWASFVTLNSSVYPGLPWIFAGVQRPLPPSLAAVRQAQGARTAYLHNGNLHWAHFRWMVAGHGYDTVEDFNDWTAPRLTSWGVEDRYLIDRLLGWIDAQRDQPFHAVCWTDQTHDPYALPPGVAPHSFFKGEAPPLAAELGRYLSVLRETDRQLGRLFAALRDRGLADETLVVIIGDHGESFRDPHEQRGHSFTVYDEEVKVPLMLWNPALFKEGRRVAEIGGLVDLNSTIADIIGLPAQGEWQGHSLFDPAHPRRTYFMAHSSDYLFGLREQNWKYIFNASTGAESLYNLTTDPAEKQNCAPSEAARCERWRQRIGAWVSFEDKFVRARESGSGNGGR